MKHQTARPTDDRWLSRLAWAVWAFTVGLLVWQVWIWSMPPSILDLTRLVAPSGDAVEAISIRQTSLWVACFLTTTMAGLIASLRPRNPIGWWLALFAFGFTWNVVGSVYARYALARNPGGLPAGELALWLSQWCTGLAQIALVSLLLLFPTGRLVSSRWKLLLWINAFGVTFYAVEHAFTAGPVETAPFSLPNNPFAIDGFPSVLGRGAAGSFVYLVCLVLTLVGLINRLRRARGAERQQLKWFAFGAAWFPLVGLAPVFVTFGTPSNAPLTRDILPIAAYIVVLATLVAMTIGILQYRLFDIDVVINRTLVYGTVTALLAGAFAALSIVTQHITLAVTGQQSQVAVVLAALIVTASFQPLRSRIQTFVDRRFYRSKYDASLTLERFTGQVRDEVNLDQLRSALIAAASETMQPAHASLWLRQSEAVTLSARPTATTETG
jgi:hypothetical protein